MKKIFTLLVATGLFAVAANAQQSPRETRDKPQYDQRNTTPQRDQRDKPQYDQRNDQQNGQWDKDYSNRNDDDRYDVKPAYGKGIQMQVNQINRKYDFKIQQVKSNFYMRRFEKTRMIRSLEEQRDREIRILYKRSGDRRLYDRSNNSNW